MLRAIIFDFDGVLADTEPVHLKLFQEALAAQGIDLTKQEYYKKYLGLDDRSFFQQVYRDRRQQLKKGELERLLRQKTRVFKRYAREHSVLLPGARRVVKSFGSRYPLAIVSGALRPEIRLILRQAGLDSFFAVIVGADEVKKTKPHPEGYRRGLKELNQKTFSAARPLKAEECLVIEDSHWGIESAHRAGMYCLALATSYPNYPKNKLRSADKVFSSLQELTLSTLKGLKL